MTKEESFPSLGITVIWACRRPLEGSVQEENELKAVRKCGMNVSELVLN